MRSRTTKKTTKSPSNNTGKNDTCPPKRPTEADYSPEPNPHRGRYTGPITGRTNGTGKHAGAIPVKQGQAMAGIPALRGAKRAKLPKALSVGEETFAFQMKLRGLTPVREYRFCETRQWRADFAFIEQRILVEIEGGAHSRGRHNRASGFEKDIEKYNAAGMQGWLVLRYTTQMVKSGLADRQVAELLGVA
jgi:very-short-patch-repair endonuclease